MDSFRITSRADGTIVVEGELSESNAAAFEAAFGALAIAAEADVSLDLLEFDLADGMAIATVINAVRNLVTSARRVRLIGAPQLLCHNLYRVGLLGTDKRIELIAMREDEPYG